MKPVLVLGLSPSVKGGNSQTLKRLNLWMSQLGYEHYSFANLYPDGIHRLTPDEVANLADGRMIIALGNTVENTLRNYRVNHVGFKIYFTKLDHPSPLNRNLNDSKYVSKMLREAKQTIKDWAE